MIESHWATEIQNNEGAEKQKPEEKKPKIGVYSSEKGGSEASARDSSMLMTSAVSSK